MRVIRVLAVADADGKFRLDLPLGPPGTECDIAVVLADPAPRSQTRTLTPEELGWPPGFFDTVAGSIDDDTFMRHEQPPLAPPVSLE